MASKHWNRAQFVHSSNRPRFGCDKRLQHRCGERVQVDPELCQRAESGARGVRRHPLGSQATFRANYGFFPIVDLCDDWKTM